MSYSVTQTHGSGGPGGASAPMLRVRVWLHRRALDRALAEGADATSDPQLAHRAARLTSPRCRRSLASGVHRMIREAYEPVRPLTSAVPMQRREVRAARDRIEQLAQDLTAPDEVQPRGVLLVHDLLTHGDSPFFMPSPDGSLDAAVRHAHAALLM